MGRTDEKYLKLLRKRYRKASRKERTAMLDEFLKTTGYHRKHAADLLDGRRKWSQEPIKRPWRATYGPEEARALFVLWQLFDHINSKRKQRSAISLGMGSSSSSPPTEPGSIRKATGGQVSTAAGPCSSS